MCSKSFRAEEITSELQWERVPLRSFQREEDNFFKVGILGRGFAVGFSVTQRFQYVGEELQEVGSGAVGHPKGEGVIPFQDPGILSALTSQEANTTDSTADHHNDRGLFREMLKGKTNHTRTRPSASDLDVILMCFLPSVKRAS
eukprot:g40126.t1